jgi:hypothetical protein
MSRVISIPSKELNSFDLPSICVVTGSREGVVFKPVKFSWYPRWVSYFAPLALIVAVILAAILRKRVRGELPFTEKAWSDWRRGRIALALSMLAAVVGLVVGVPFAFTVDPNVGLASLAAVVGLPVLVGVTLLRGRAPVVMKITDTEITLRLPSDVAADAINARLFQEGRDAA